MSKQIELSTATKSLAEYTSEFSEDNVILTLNGKAIAAVFSLKNIDDESLSLSLNSDFISIIEKARKEITQGETLSLSEMKVSFEEE
jgi:hypothetical protein